MTTNSDIRAIMDAALITQALMLKSVIERDGYNTLSQNDANGETIITFLEAVATRLEELSSKV